MIKDITHSKVYIEASAWNFKDILYFTSNIIVAADASSHSSDEAFIATRHKTHAG